MRRAPALVPVSKVTLSAVVLLLGATVVVVPGALNRFVFGKLAVAVIGAALAALSRPAGRLPRQVRIVVTLAAAVLLVASLASAEPVAAILGRAPRYEGVFVVAAYICAAWAGARLLGPGADDRIALAAVRVLAVLAILVGFFALLEAAGLRPLSTDVSRPGSLLGNASDEGVVGVLCFAPLVLVAFRRRDVFLAVGALAAVVVAVLSASRGALLAVLVEVALLGLLMRGGRRAVAVLVAATVAIAALALAVPATRHRVLGTSPLAGHTLTGRELLWRETAALDASHLGLGVGPSNFKSAIVAEHTREWQSKVGPQDPPDSPHSLPLQALSAGGVPLLTLCLLLFGLAARAGWRRCRESLDVNIPIAAGAAISITGYVIAGLVGLTSPGPLLLASALGGVVLSEAGPAKTPDRTAWMAIPMSVLAAVFALAATAEIPLRHAILDVARGNNQAADRAFAAARDLRPWDVDLPDVAAHAFVVQGLADGDATAITEAGRWLGRVPHELRKDEQVELDTASFDEARGQYAAAESVLTRVLADDRDNPAVLLQRGVVEVEAQSLPAAERDFRAAASIAPNDPGPWTDLSALYTEEHRIVEAAAAQAHADRLSSSR